VPAVRADYVSATPDYPVDPATRSSSLASIQTPSTNWISYRPRSPELANRSSNRFIAKYRWPSRSSAAASRVTRARNVPRLLSDEVRCQFCTQFNRRPRRAARPVEYSRGSRRWDCSDVRPCAIGGLDRFRLCPEFLSRPSPNLVTSVSRIARVRLTTSRIPITTARSSRFSRGSEAPRSISS
jgi:hypothetical protein